MAVNTTPNIGLAKPTETELAKDWVVTPQWTALNNLTIVDQMDIGLTNFVPSFVAVTTNPSVGAGQIQMEYIKVNGFIIGQFALIALDPGVAAGSGSGGYGISLPELADTSFHTASAALNTTPGVASCLGEGNMIDASTIDNSGTLAFDLIHTGGVAYLRPIVETYAGKVNRWMGPTVPFTFATGDGITGSFCYKVA